MKIADTFEFLLGTWLVSRSIEDRRDGVRGSFEGIARLVPRTSWAEGGAATGACLPPGSRAGEYGEEGELHLGRHSGQASRHLDCAGLSDATVMLYRAGGRPFVDLDLRRGMWRAAHLCGGDRYEVATYVRSLDLVEEEWVVRGDLKDYVLHTTLRRHR